MDDIDVWRTAKLLIDAHGPLTAWQRAAARVVKLLGEAAGQAAWTRVIKAVDELTRTERRNGERAH